MKVFVTGASGFLGSAITRTLISHGHTVTALSRSSASAAKLTSLGATPLPGSLEDLGLLTSAARDADAVIHVAFIHDFSAANHDFIANCQKDVEALRALGEGLKGSGKVLVSAGNLGGGPVGRAFLENDPKDSSDPRKAAEDVLNEMAKEGVRGITVRLPPTVHGADDWGFITTLIDTAKTSGHSIVVDEGNTKWVAVHKNDAAELFRLAVESNDSALPGGSVLHAVENVRTQTNDIAQLISEKVGVPVKRVSADEAKGLFGFMGLALGMEFAVGKEATVKATGWKIKEAGLLEDMNSGSYF